MTRHARVAGLSLISLALLYTLVCWSGLTWPVIAKTIGGLSVTVLTCIIVLTFANLAFGTIKWLLVLRALTPDVELCPHFNDAMLTTTAGALLGQVMPVQLGIGLTRSVAGRMGIGWNSRVNLGTTAYEQLFDAVALYLACAVGVLGLVIHPGPVGWAALILVWATAGLTAAMRLPWLLGAASKLLGRAPAVMRRLNGFFPNFASAAERIADLPLTVPLSLMVLSILRYIASLMRAVIVLSALGMSAFTVLALLAFPLVQTIAFLPITPGNLGITEWTWSAVLVSAGATMSEAALFTLTLRIVSIVAQFIFVAIFLAFRIEANFHNLPVIRAISRGYARSRIRE